jgi:hypothetical protein
MRTTSASTDPEPRGAMPSPTARESDRQAFLATLGLVCGGAAVCAVGFLGAPDRAGTVVLLCLFAVVAVGRGLLGSEAAPEDRVTGWLAAYAVPIVFLTAVLVHLPSLRVGLLSDDYGLVALARRLPNAWAALTAPELLLFRPLHHLTWWVQERTWGEAAVGYHLVSLVLHGANAVLVNLLGWRLTGRREAGLMAGLLFAVSPLYTEPVVWACGQADLQSALFALLSLLSLDASLRATVSKRRRWLVLGALVAFLAAALTKESALPLPAIAALWVWVRSDRERLRRAVRTGLAYGLVLAIYFPWRLANLGGFGGYPARDLTWLRFLPWAPVNQVSAFLFPVPGGGLSALHLEWLSLGVAAPLAALLWWWARGTVSLPRRQLAFCLCFLTLGTIPVWILPSPSGDLQNGRFTYLPTIGFAWLAGAAWSLAPSTGRLARAAPVVAIGFLGALSLCGVVPWLRARDTTAVVLAEGQRVAQSIPASISPATLYVQDLPEGDNGTQVFRNGFREALSSRLPARIRVVAVTPESQTPPEAMALTVLGRGEYLYRWEAKRRRLALVRAGPSKEAAR